MMEYSIHAFYTTAKRYCRFLREWVIDSQSASELIVILMDLYRLAGRLPAGNAILSEEADRDLRKTGYGEEGPFACRVKIDPDYPALYYGQLDPFCNEQEDCRLSLAVDLGDIYDDLESGIVMYENDKKAQAACTWRNGFEIHWGRHAVNAIRVLHEYATRDDLSCNSSE